LMAAIRKMTLMPARRLEARVPAMRMKGRLRAGADADITIVDPATVIDRSTYREPALPPRGIRHVIVNGVVVTGSVPWLTGNTVVLGSPAGYRGPGILELVLRCLGRLLHRRRGRGALHDRPTRTARHRGVLSGGLVVRPGEYRDSDHRARHRDRGEAGRQQPGQPSRVSHLVAFRKVSLSG